jgi:rhamnogalacturonyl hydrolase YesR
MFSLVPFYSLYTTSFTPENSTTVNDDILLQLDLLWEHCYDNTTGLLFHGYDASKTAVWANPISGSSSIVWSRSLGWYVMAVVDYLELKTLPEHLWRGLLERFIALADALINTADPQTGSWWQAMNFPGRSGNYIESSGSAMFTYALYKGVRLGYLGNGKTPAAMYSAVASKAYRYIVDTFIVHNVNGTLSYNGTVSVCSLNSTATYEVCTHSFLDFIGFD